MNIAVAGGTGFLGRPLVHALAAEGHDVIVLSRSSSGGIWPATRVTVVPWTPDGRPGVLAGTLDGIDIVVNLAGESIADGRWTAARKKQLVDSRIDATRSLAAAIAAARVPPRVLISGSAVGYYGPRGDEPVTEASPPGDDFLARLCVQWEEEATRAASDRTRVILLRTGIVLAAGGGALAKMILPFKLFAGGPMGSGRQYWPWIHLDDWVGLALWTIANDQARGPFNATAPTPVTNAELSRALGRALHRPSLLPAPGFALRLALGEMAEALLLNGQRVVPEKALRYGFVFKYPTIDGALRAAVGGQDAA